MLQKLDPVQRYYAERALKQIRRNIEQERLRKVEECVKLYSERMKDFEDCQFLPLEKELPK